MRPVYWIPVLALIGGIAGYAIVHTTGWLGTGTGIVVGIVLGAIVYSAQKD